MKRKMARLVPAVLVLTISAAPLTVFAAEPKFQQAAPSYSLPAGSRITDLAFADMNGDGNQDAILSDLLNDRIAILKGNGNGTFETTPAFFAVGDGLREIAIADFNKDGIQDVAVTSYNTDTVSILLGTGDGTLGPQATFPAGDGPHGIDTADLDGDGNIDLAIADNDNHKLSILYGSGDGTFTRTASYPVGTYPRYVLIKDFNGDGQLDLAVPNDYSGNISVLLNIGEGQYTITTYGNIRTPAKLVSGDFNGDGVSDLATAANGENGASVLLGHSDGSFDTPILYNTGRYPLDITMGDYNGDSILDLAVTNQVDPNSILFGNGDGTFQSKYDLPSNGYVGSGDWNSDGLSDLAYASGATFHPMTSRAEGELAFSQSSYSVSENAGTVNVTVTRTGGSYGQTKVRIQTLDGTALAGADYTAVDDTIIFNKGETTKVHPINVTDNSTYTENKTFNVIISTPTNEATLGTQTGTAITILEDDSVPDITAPSIDSAQFTAVDNYTGTPDQLMGTAGAVSESGAEVQAYHWNDTDADGVVDAGELSSSIALGTSAADGSIPAANIGDLAPGTYKFVITATDGQGNESAKSAAAAVTLSLTKGVAPDGSDPVWPAGSLLAESNITRNSARLSWAAADDNRGVDHYELLQDGLPIDTVNATTLEYSVTGLVPDTSYDFAVVAVDSSGNRSTLLTRDVETLPLVDPAKFSVVDHYEGTSDQLVGEAGAIGRSGAEVQAYRWNDTDADGVVDAGELSSSIALGTSAADGSIPAANIGDLAPGTYKFVITATDAQGNESAKSAAASVTITLTKGVTPDVSEPAWPAGSLLAESNITRNSARLSWPAADDNRGVDYYELLQDGVPIDTVNATTLEYSVTGLVPGTSYDFAVVAVDTSGNRSALLTTDVETSPLVDPAKFSVVDHYEGTSDQLVGEAGAIGRSGAEVQAYRWNDTDANGVVDIGELSSSIALGTSAADGSVPAAAIGDLAPGTYKFVITATDAQGNESAKSAAASSVTITLTKGVAPDVSEPVWPAGSLLAESNITRNSARLSWAAADDNRGVDYYELLQDGVPIDTVNATTLEYSVDNLVPGTSYDFAVVAVDSSGNRSALLTTDVETSPLVDPAKFSVVNHYEGTSDQLLGGAGAIGRSGAEVQAYRWNDTDADGVVDAGELSSSIALGTSAADGSVRAADIGDLAPGTYKFVITATDAQGNESAKSAAAAVTLTLTKGVTPDGSDPVWPAGSLLAGSNITHNGLQLTWPAADDNRGVDHYELLQDGVPITTVNPKVLTYDVKGLAVNTSYRFAVHAIDAAGNRSAALSATVSTAPEASAAQPSFQSSESRLQGLELTAGVLPLDLSPLFSPDVFDYKAKTTEARIELAAASLFTGATVLVNGQKAVRNTPVPIDLNMGINKIVIQVQASNGSILTYNLMIERITPSSDLPEEQPEVQSPFNDIRGHWSEAEVNEAYALGIVNGELDGMFTPNRSITRAEWLVMVARTLQLTGNSTPAGESTFLDSGQIPVWAREAVTSIVAQGIIQGYPDGSFRPNVTITRAEAAVILIRAAQLNTDNNGATSFADDSNIPSWVKPYASAASESGLLTGTGGNRFSPAASTTRAEAAVMMVRLSRLIRAGQ